MSHKVLVTGGAGYIGSHAVIELYNRGYIPIIIDNSKGEFAKMVLENSG